MNEIPDNLTLHNLGVDNGRAPANGTSYTYDEQTAIFMKKFSGEVFNAYKKTCLFKDLQRTRTITRGKSASFNYTGRMDARYHTRGTPILGNNNPPISEQIINVDSLLISDVAIDNLDELMLHFDVRKEYSEKSGEALALAYDDRIARVAVLAARHAALNADQDGGTVLSHALAATDGQVLADMLYLAAQTFDEKDVPETDRHIIVKPAQYYLLLAVKDLINKDYGGSGSYQKADLKWVADMILHKSNRVPQTNVTSRLAGEHNDYTGDFTNTVGLVMNKRAVGTVQLRGLKLQKSGADFNIMYQADMMVASYAVGHGILDPSGAIEISKSGSQDDNTDDTVIVNTPQAVVPTIGTDLSSTDTATHGTAKTLTVAATVSDSGTLSYQWFKQADSNAEPEAVSGANAASYTFTPAAAGSAIYYCVITNTKNSTVASKMSTKCTLTIS